MRPLVPLVLLAALVGCGGERGPGGPSPERPPPATEPKPGAEAPRCPRALDPGAPPPAASFDTGVLVGLPEREARRRAARGGCTLRVIERDGEPLVRTEDLRGDRVNVKVRRGVVRAIDGVY